MGQSLCTLSTAMALIGRRDDERELLIVEGLARAPYARDVAAVHEEARMAIGQEVSAALQAYRDGDDFITPAKSHLVQARVS